MIKNAIQIKAIYISPSAGAAMEELQQAKLSIQGIDKDRYAIGTGAYSNALPPKIRHISLIAETGIAKANEWLATNHKPTFKASETRRNVVLTNITADELNQLIGHTFVLGTTTLKGVELCTPCQRPAHLLKKPNFIDAFEGRGGLRAEVLIPGTISVGDCLSLNNQDTK